MKPRDRRPFRLFAVETYSAYVRRLFSQFSLPRKPIFIFSVLSCHSENFSSLLWISDGGGCRSVVGDGFGGGFQCEECTDRKHVLVACWMVLEAYSSVNASVAMSRSFI